MRYHITTAFSEARKQYVDAMAQYASFDDDGEGGKEREEAAWLALDAASTALFEAKALTPTEMLAKLDAAVARGGDDFPLTAFYSLASIRSDLGRMRQMSLSDEFAGCWTAWRRVELDIVDLELETPQFETASDLRVQLYCEIAMKPCITPGDFILKRYLSLITRLGSCDTISRRESMTANPWDIDIERQRDEPARLDRADLLGEYDDIDGTDLGANLLAYGHPEFNAEAWMEAADRVGQHVDLCEAPDGRWAVGFSMSYPDHDPRLNRERDRLLRLVNFPYDGSKDRLSQLADEIRNEWPQLVRSLPAEAVRI